MNIKKKKININKHPAVVVGLNVGGLGVIRALSEKKIRTIGVDSTFAIPGAQTRLCRKVKCQSIENDTLIETLIDIAKRSSYKPVLYLCEDVAVMVVAKNIREIEKFYFLNFPEVKTVETLMDKKLFSQYAQKNKLSAPAYYTAQNMPELEKIADKAPFPCILKPTFRTAEYNEYAPSKAYQIKSPEELVSIYKIISPWIDEVIIQEWIPGSDDQVLFSLMYYDTLSKCTVSLCGRKLRQWHPETGTASIVESIENETVRVESEKLFDLVKYRGMGSVEFKKDPRDGKLKLIEATVGRADWLSYLAVASGINIPYIYYCDILFGRKLPVTPAIYGVKWIVDDNDLKAAFYYFIKGELSIKKWINTLHGPRSFAYFNKKDIGPWIFLLIQLFLKIFFNIFQITRKIKLISPNKQ